MKFVLWIILSLLFLISPSHAESICYGNSANGHLDGGVALPQKGPNFFTYSSLAHLAGRTYVHSTVRDIVLEAYKALEGSHPDKIYKYAETGFRKGGQFRPHKTHRNGTSVDFMTPMMDRQGVSTTLPTHAFNRLGYDIELDANGHYKEYSIDYEAMAAHIVALDKTAKAKGVGLWRVIFDPALQAPLFKTSNGDYLRKNITFSTKRSWVRHDEHYHVDFSIPCQK